MKKIITPVLASALLSSALLVGCRVQTVDTQAEEEELMRISREWSRVASTDSVEKILSYWADDAMVYGCEQLPVIGKEALREMVDASFKTPGFRISWEPVEAFVSKSGDIGYLIERNQITMNDAAGNPTTIYGEGVTIWRKDATGAWKNVVESIPFLPATKK